MEANGRIIEGAEGPNRWHPHGHPQSPIGNPICSSLGGISNPMELNVRGNIAQSIRIPKNAECIKI